MQFNIEYNNKSIELSEQTPDLGVIRDTINASFGLNSDEYTLCYVDIDGDPIAIEDADDLSVCILEFSENSKIGEQIKILVVSKNPSIPRRRDTPKGSRKNSTEKKSPNLDADNNVLKVDSMTKNIVKSELLESQVEDPKDAESHISLAPSQLSIEDISKSVMNMMKSTMDEELENKIEALMEKKLKEKNKEREERKSKKKEEKKKLAESKALKKKQKAEQVKLKTEMKLKKKQEKVERKKSDQDLQNVENIKYFDNLHKVEIKNDETSLKDLQKSKLELLFAS